MKQSKHQRRDAAPIHRSSSPRGTSASSSAYWLYGAHAVEAALLNPERKVRRIVASAQALERLMLPKSRTLPQPETMEPRAIDQLLGSQTVHQGIGAYVEPLSPFVLEDIIHI